MAIYAIGDIQGCFFQLQELLAKINYDDNLDALWLTGDLVNRGPASLEVLRYLKASHHSVIVLGNHDLHLLAVIYAGKKLHRKDTLHEVLKAPDADELADWLRRQPLLHYDRNLHTVLVHAGLPPMWDIEKAQELAQEVEAVLRGDDIKYFLSDLYGDEAAKWQDSLSGISRLRCIVNYLTRMRFCYADGSLELHYKGAVADKPAHLMPWFEIENRKTSDVKIIFGHWAALEGQVRQPNLYPLDTGCVWGDCLTALRLHDEVRFSVEC